MTGQMCGFLVCLDASSSRSNSPSSSCRFRSGDEGGIFTLSTGLDESINPPLVHRYLEAVPDQGEVVMTGAPSIEEPTVPEGSDGL